MPQKSTHPDVVARARALAETSLLSFRAIALETGVSATTLAKHARQDAWQRPGRAPPRHLLTTRLWLVADQQLASIEAQLKDGASNAALRDLSVLAKVMRDLAAFEGEAGTQPPPAPAKTDAEIRDTIWQRILQLRALEGPSDQQ